MELRETVLFTESKGLGSRVCPTPGRGSLTGCVASDKTLLVFRLSFRQTDEDLLKHMCLLWLSYLDLMPPLRNHVPWR